MKQHLRLATYAGTALALLVVALLVPAAWATSSPRHPAQTVPTRGPSPTFAVTFAPTEAPTGATTPQPAATPRPDAPTVPGATATPMPAPVATALPAPASLVLTKEADPIMVWPGLDVTFTLVLTNQGANSVRNVVVEDALPLELIPGSILSPAATWDGRTLRALTSLLPPGGRFVVTFAAQVRADLAPGGIIVNQTAATATGSQRATAGIVLVLPPVELPPTGAGPASSQVGSRVIDR